MVTRGGCGRLSLVGKIARYGQSFPPMIGHVVSNWRVSRICVLSESKGIRKLYVMKRFGMRDTHCVPVATMCSYLLSVAQCDRCGCNRWLVCSVSTRVGTYPVSHSRTGVLWGRLCCSRWDSDLNDWMYQLGTFSHWSTINAGRSEQVLFSWYAFM